MKTHYTINFRIETLHSTKFPAPNCRLTLNQLILSTLIFPPRRRTMLRSRLFDYSRSRARRRHDFNGVSHVRLLLDSQPLFPRVLQLCVERSQSSLFLSISVRSHVYIAKAVLSLSRSLSRPLSLPLSFTLALPSVPSSCIISPRRRRRRPCLFSFANERVIFDAIFCVRERERERERERAVTCE